MGRFVQRDSHIFNDTIVILVCSTNKIETLLFNNITLQLQRSILQFTLAHSNNLKNEMETARVRMTISKYTLVSDEKEIQYVNYANSQ